MLLAQGARYADWAYLLPRYMADVILEAPYRMVEACRDPLVQVSFAVSLAFSSLPSPLSASLITLVQTFAVDEGLWSYKIMDCTQLNANVSAPLRSSPLQLPLLIL